MSKPFLSIIVPTARFSRSFLKTLRYLRRICKIGDEIEVVIVSTCDNPANRLYEYLCKADVNCKLIVLERLPGQDLRARQKNLGVLQASSRYIYLLDDDAFPTCKLINELLKLLRADEVDAALHTLVPYPVSIWAKVRMIEKILSSFYLERSSCRILRRDLFIKLGGYREELVLGEDIEFQDRLLVGRPKIIAILPDKGFEIHLGEYKTLSAYIRRAYYYGRHMKTLAQYIGVRRMLHAYVATPIAIRDMPKYFRLYILALILYEVVIALATIVGRLFGKKYE